MRAMFSMLVLFATVSPAFAQSLRPWPVPADAQATEDRTRLLEATISGRLLTVHLDTPKEPLVGRLRAVDADSVEIAIGPDTRRIRFADITRISHEGDSVTNGAVIGMAVLGGWCAYICGQGLTSGGQTVLAVLLNGAIGAGIGALIDKAHTGTTTVYRRRTAVRIAPAASTRAAGISASVTW